MNVFGSSDEHQPVTWVRGYPIYAAHLVVGIFVASMIATAVLMAIGATGILGWLRFSSEAVLRGEAWRILSYGLVNPPSLWFAVDMLMIVWFGRELERFFGRPTFVALFASLYVLSPVVLTLIGLRQPTSLSGETGAFALFIAFATLYPDAMMMFNLLAKWFALILVGLYSLMALSNRDLVGLITLWSTIGFAFAFVRHQQGHFRLPSFRFNRNTPKLRALPDLDRKQDAAPRDTSMAEVDALLDKIAKSGIASLSAKERSRLDAARDDLLKKPGRR